MLGGTCSSARSRWKHFLRNCATEETYMHHVFAVSSLHFMAVPSHSVVSSSSAVQAQSAPQGPKHLLTFLLLLLNRCFFSTFRPILPFLCSFLFIRPPGSGYMGALSWGRHVYNNNESLQLVVRFRIHFIRANVWYLWFQPVPVCRLLASFWWYSG